MRAFRGAANPDVRNELCLVYLNDILWEAGAVGADLEQIWTEEVDYVEVYQGNCGAT